MKKGCASGCFGFVVFVVLGFIGLMALVAYLPTPKPLTPEEIAANAEREKQAEVAAAEQSKLAAKQSEEAHKQLQRDVDVYVQRLTTAGVDASLIGAVTAKDGWVIVTVQNPWHVMHKQLRLQAAQNLLRIWLGVRKPSNPELEMIKLVDINGNKVGSGSLNGISVID